MSLQMQQNYREKNIWRSFGMGHDSTLTTSSVKPVWNIVMYGQAWLPVALSNLWVTCAYWWCDRRPKHQVCIVFVSVKQTAHTSQYRQTVVVGSNEMLSSDVSMQVSVDVHVPAKLFVTTQKYTNYTRAYRWNTYLSCSISSCPCLTKLEYLIANTTRVNTAQGLSYVSQVKNIQSQLPSNGVNKLSHHFPLSVIHVRISVDDFPGSRNFSQQSWNK